MKKTEWHLSNWREYYSVMNVFDQNSIISDLVMEGHVITQ